MHIYDSFRAAFRKRDGPNRKYILVLLMMMIFTVLAFSGEGNVSFSYVRLRYNWGVDEYSNYASVVSLASISAQAIVVPLMALLKINEALVLVAIMLTFLAKHVSWGFASEPWIYYFGGLIDSAGSYSFSIIRSMLSTCVEMTELGKVYAFLSAMDSLLPIGVSQMATYIFEVI